MTVPKSRFAWICKGCFKKGSTGQIRTSAELTRLARDHGCLRVQAPSSKRESRELVRIQGPRLLPEEEWRRVWDSLDMGEKALILCRQGCGHPEGSHYFSSVTVTDCSLNCNRCRSGS